MKKQGKQNTNSNDFCTFLSLPLQGSLRSQDTTGHDSTHSFCTVWKVDAGDVIEFDTYGLYTVDWGDGCTEQVNIEQGVGDLKHTYVKKGEYTVSISSGVTGFWLGDESAKKLIEIKQWGAAQWEGMNSMFAGAGNMICTATDTPDTSKVKDMAYMFYECLKFNSPIEHWDTKGVTFMSGILSHARMFNRSLANMDISSVKYMSSMLEDTPAFDQDLRDFNIGAKADADHLFGWTKSLVQYNLEQAERFDAQDEKQDVYSVLNG